MISGVPNIQQGCDPNSADCAPCPDCIGPPGNPDGCSIGTNPLTGGCVGSGGIEIRFIPGGYLAYCTPPYAFGCFNYPTPPLGASAGPREGCTANYTWYEEWFDTVYECVLPFGAISGEITYEDETGDVRGPKTYVFPVGASRWRQHFTQTITWFSSTEATVFGSNGPIAYGYASFATISLGQPPP